MQYGEHSDHRSASISRARPKKNVAFIGGSKHVQTKLDEGNWDGQECHDQRAEERMFLPETSLVLRRGCLLDQGESWPGCGKRRESVPKLVNKHFVPMIHGQ